MTFHFAVPSWGGFFFYSDRMELHYSGQEQIQAPPALIWAFLDDPQRLALAFPELQDVRVLSHRQIEGVVSVGGGFLKARLRLRIEVEPSPDTGEVTIRVTGTGMGSTLELRASGRVTQTDRQTTFAWQAEAKVGGPLAKMGGGVADAQARALLTRTFANLRNQIEAQVRTLA